MRHFSSPPNRNLLDLDRAAGITGLSRTLIQHLVILRLLTPITKASDGNILFSPDQAAQMEILGAMNSLNFGLEQMRGMVTLMEILDTEPACPPTEHHRTRLGVFLQYAARRPVTNEDQLAARTILINTLQQRYSWLA